MAAVMAAITPAREADASADELARLKREYLPMWAERDRGAVVAARGFPTGVPYRDYMKPMVPAVYDTEDVLDPVVCKLVDAGIDELTGLAGMSLARAALSVRYMSAGLPSVFRSGRITNLELLEIEDLCDQAEIRLVPIVKRRGLPL